MTVDRIFVVFMYLILKDIVDNSEKHYYKFIKDELQHDESVADIQSKRLSKVANQNIKVVLSELEKLLGVNA